MARLVVLGASPSIARVARGLGCDVCLVQRPGSPVEELVVRGTASPLYTVDYTGTGFASFVDRVLRSLGVEAVVSVTEDGLVPAAWANELLGLPGTPLRVAQTLRDKALMRTLLRTEAPELSVRFATPIDRAEAARIAAGWGAGEVVLKPRDGSASLGVTRIGVETLAGHDVSGQLMEEFIPGQEYSAETFSSGGEHRLLAITEKHTGDGFVELAHVVPPTSLTADAVAVASQGVARFLDAVGLTDGPAHTEFKFTSGGIRIIESHNRIAGDGIPQLVQRVSGIDLKAWSLGWPLELGAPQAPVPVSAAAAIAFATALPGVVKAVRMPEPGTAWVDYMWTAVTEGDPVHELTCSAARVGGVSVLADNPAEALATARALAERITVTTRPAS